MFKFKRIAVLLVLLIVVVVIVGFVLENQQSIVISFLGWSTPSLPASVFLTLSLIIGMLIGPVISFFFRGFRREGARRKQVE